jgi:hypothetical protein
MEKLYAAQLKDSNYIIITDIPCKICFLKKSRSTISFFIEITGKLDQWKKISSATINGKCKCENL